MAISFKERKRIRESENGIVKPLKTSHDAVQNPLFRQQGYELKFESVNSDYLDVDENLTIANISDIDISVSFISDSYDSAQYIYEKGSFGSALTGYIRLFRDGSDSYTLQLRKAGVYYDQIVFTALEGVNNTVYFNGLEVFLNGVLIKTFTDTNIDINLNGSPLGVSASGIEGGSPSQFYNGTITDLKYQGEQFNFSESIGTTITGSNGTTATINTSAAQSENYINTEVWNKKPFALGFDALNSEYLNIDNQIQGVTNTNQFDMSFDISMDDTLFNNDGECLFVRGQEFVTYSFLFSRYAINDWTYAIRDESGNIVKSAVFTNTPTSLKLIEIKNDTILFDGVVKHTFGNIAVNFIDNDRFRVCGRVNIDFANYTIEGINIQNEQFPLTYGLGNTIKGTNGTIATINTSASQAKDQINYGIWRYFDGSNWIPYIKQ